MNKNNKLLALGISVILCGVSLLVYSITTYAESKQLYERIDFDSIDNNNQMSTSDKYIKYLSIADYLNQEMNKRKNLPIKNASCMYIDYAQHNANSMYKLIFTGIRDDGERRTAVEDSIKSLDSMLDFYQSCKKTSQYKAELKTLLEEIDKAQDLYVSADIKMDTFLNGSGLIEPPAEEQPQAQTQQSETNNTMTDETYQQYLETNPSQTPQQSQ
jgi:hypothetical protein